MLTAAVLVCLACLVWPSSRRIPMARAPTTSPRGVRPAWRAVLRDRAPACTVRTRHPWVADFAEVVAVGLDAGLDLGSATLAAARSPGVATHAPWLSVRLAAAVADGRGVAALVVEESTRTADEQRDLRLLVAAWHLAEDVGAATAAVTAAAAAAIRGRHASRARTAVVAAGPRASMWLLSALPVAGPVAAALVGIGPARLYATGAARLFAVAGLLLTGVGWWWARSLLRRAQRAGRTDGNAG